MTITNADDAAWRAFYIYYNTCDYVPYKYVWVGPGGTVFVSLPGMFQGRITRGTDEVCNIIQAHIPLHSTATSPNRTSSSS